jgi:hypothetical protein
MRVGLVQEVQQVQQVQQVQLVRPVRMLASWVQPVRMLAEPVQMLAALVQPVQPGQLVQLAQQAVARRRQVRRKPAWQVRRRRASHPPAAFGLGVRLRPMTRWRAPSERPRPASPARPSPPRHWQGRRA